MVALFIATPGQLNIQPRIDGAKDAIKKSGKKIRRADDRDRRHGQRGAVEDQGLLSRPPGREGHVRGRRRQHAGRRPRRCSSTACRRRACMAAASTCCRARSQLIHDGFLDFTIDQQPYLQGFYTVMEMFTFLASGGLVGSGGHQHRPEIRHQGQRRRRTSTTKTRYEGKSDERRSCRARARSGVSVRCGGRRTQRREGAARARCPALARGEHHRRRRRAGRLFRGRQQQFPATNANLQNLSQFIAAWAIIACGEIMLLICGEIDLSVGHGVRARAVHDAFRAPRPACRCCSRCCWRWSRAALIGLVNGVITVRLRVPSSSRRSARCSWSTASR